MRIVTEGDAKRLVTMAEAIEAVETAFAAFHSGEGEVFPVAHGRGSTAGARFSMKSALLPGKHLCGMKLGTYWPGNPARGLESHGSTTLLLDDRTGLPIAVLEASHLTAMRTAAADGAGIKHLARPDAHRLAVIGAGHQAWYEIQAARAVRPIDHVAVWARRSDQAEELAARVRRDLAIDAVATSLEQAIADADIVITITSSTSPVVDAHHVRPGTHVSAMGADSPTKQELGHALAQASRLFADVPAQSVTMGEFRSASAAGVVSIEDVTPLGAVIRGFAPGRVSAEDVTIFDSSGMALQDLAISSLVLEKMDARG